MFKDIIKRPPPWKPALASYTHLLLFIKESLLLLEV